MENEVISIKNTKQEIFDAYQSLLKLQETPLGHVDEQEAALDTKGDTPLSIVIPYVKKLAQGEELKYALRGWDRHFKEDFNIVIIGDREPWMSDLVHVIETERMSENPPIDIAHKMLRAIESELVSEKFVWTNDDQYLVSPVMMADLETLKCTGRLEKKNLAGSLYLDNKARTLKLLKGIKGKDPIWDFSIHFPFVFIKSRLKEVIEECNLTKEAMLIATLYYNLVYPFHVPYNLESQSALEHDNLKAGVYRPNADLSRLRRLIPGKKVIGNSERGYSKEFMSIVAEVLPWKSRFEI